MLKPEVLQQKQADLEKQYAELGKLAATLERDLAVENAKLTQDLLKQAEPIIKDIAKGEGVTSSSSMPARRPCGGTRPST